MTPILYAVAALLATTLGLVAYQFAIAFVGTSFGIRLREIEIGSGPTLFRKAGPGWTFRLRAIPTSGNTRFHDRDDPPSEETAQHQDSAPQGGLFSDATPLAQMLTTLIGPLLALVLGCVCLAIPVWIGSPQLEACSPAESQLQPCAVPGLRLDAEPANWRGQVALVRETAVEFARRLVTFQSLEGWGGPIGFVVTAGGVGSKLSYAAWLSCIGVLHVWSSLCNLLPCPLLNGFQFLLALGRGITGRELPENTKIVLTYLGLLVLLVFMGRVLWVDIRWLGNLWF